MKAALVFIGLSWIAIITLLINYRAPWMDEGYYAMGTYNYLHHGQMDARQIEPSAYVVPESDKPDTGVDKRAYFQMPLEMVLQVGWEKMVGWGLKQQRYFSAIFGIMALFCWFGFLRRLIGEATAAAATVLIAFDWNFLGTAALGRMDMMSHACGVAALYFHERYYASRPSLARALSSASLCAAALSHPDGFFIWGAVYAARSLSQWRQWRLREWLAFSGPAAISLAGFFWWISYDPVAFRDQMSANGAFRFASLTLNDLPRYGRMYGLLFTSMVSQRFKVYPLLFFAAGYMMVLKWGARKTKGFKTCLMLTAVAVFTLAVVDSTKWPYYGVHTVPWLAVLAAFGYEAAWARGWKKSVQGALALYMMIPLASALVAAHRNPLATTYQPAVEALRRASREGAVVFAPPEFIFGYPDFIFDLRFGYISHKTASTIVSYQDTLDETLRWAKDHNPGLFAHVQRVLHTDCRTIFSNPRYTVYACAPPSKEGT